LPASDACATRGSHLIAAYRFLGLYSKERLFAVYESDELKKITFLGILKPLCAKTCFFFSSFAGPLKNNFSDSLVFLLLKSLKIEK